MIIEKLITKNYTRLYVTNIKQLVYCPNMKIQSIIGLNGSGKSSLLKELIPNTKDLKTEYGAGGFKQLTVKHNKHRYVISYTRDTDIHSFKMDGEELNQAGIKKIQDTLIETHFRLDKNIVDLLLSLVQFTTMTVGERKRWFTEILSTIDYSYAMKIYANIKNRNRDLIAYSKLIQSKLMKDKTVLDTVDDNYIASIKERIDFLNIFINQCVQTKLPSQEIDIKKFKNTLQSLNEDGFYYLKKLQTLPEGFSKNQLEQRLNDALLSLEWYKEDNRRIIKEIDKIENLKLTPDDSSSKLTSELKDISDKISKLNEENKLLIDLNYIEMISSEFKFILPTLISYSTQLYELRDVSIDRDKYSEYLNKLNKITPHLKGLEAKIKGVRDELDRLGVRKESGVLTCPKCHFEYIEGYDETYDAQLKKQYKLLIDEENNLKKEQEDISEKIKQIDSKINLIDSFKNLLSTDLLVPLLRYILKTTDIVTEVNLVTVLNSIMITLECLESYVPYKERVTEIQNKLLILKQLSDNKVKIIFEDLDRYRKNYSDNIIKINKLNDEIDRYKRMNTIYKKSLSFISDMESVLKKIRLMKKYVFYNLRNDYLNTLILETKKEITSLETELLEIENVKKHHQELTEELEDYIKRIKLTKQLIDIVSPNKGIIGKSITPLINSVLAEMNYIISSVWTYPIEILPCDLTDDDLDFKFPVLINGVKQIIDISKGSSSIKDIIDFAFKLTAMRLLGIENYPLILDEFGKTMDQTHRIKAYEYIDQLSKDYFSQIFIVSHFEGMYNRFTHVDIVVISEENITIPSRYNEVIELK